MKSKIIYNTDWAKENISMPELLRYFGHEPVRLGNRGTEYWYVSPFRYEKQPSFHTSYIGNKWIWNDFGRGDVQGRGTVIGFMELHENVDVKGALQLLKNMFPNRGVAISVEALKAMPLFKKVDLAIPTQQNRGSEKLVIRKIKEQGWNKALIGYLAGERKINYKLARRYLRAIDYENTETGNSYYTLGFINESSDFECRDKYFKGILKTPSAIDRNAAKDISFIPGQEHTKVAVFEGFMDFLTVLTIKGVEVLPIDVIVLNMANMRKRALDFIKRLDYQEVFTFFDNDSAGEKTTQIFTEELGRLVKPQNHLYQGYKDYNEYWQNHCKSLNLA
jgi:5S rRNA maturation endonuclease (ribonuclease M5)